VLVGLDMGDGQVVALGQVNEYDPEAVPVQGLTSLFLSLTSYVLCCSDSASIGKAMNGRSYS
jgi:hypothetical protein